MPKTVTVALRKESVDRNEAPTKQAGKHVQVALRKESVDRNENAKPAKQAKAVALRKESVDRNNRRFRAVNNAKSRSPQGERG